MEKPSQNMQLSVVRHQFSMLAKATISGWSKGKGRSADSRTPVNVIMCLKNVCEILHVTLRIIFPESAIEGNRQLKVQELVADVKESLVKGEAVEIGRVAFKNYAQFSITYCLLCGFSGLTY
ncbi:unnamed protein product [Malus baccata var. baccata]